MTEIPFIEGLHTVRGECRTWHAADGWGRSYAGPNSSEISNSMFTTISEVSR